MNVRMRPRQRVAAVLAAAAGARLGASAQQPLTEPEREPLLADPDGPLKQEGGRERIASDGVVEAAANRVVAVQWEERHGGKVRRAGPFRRVAVGSLGRHGS
jgi:hypothetical protein